MLKVDQTKIVYSSQRTGFLPEFRYSNPRYFDVAKEDVKTVVIVGDWPKVVAAYEARGMDVRVISSPAELRVNKVPGTVAAKECPNPAARTSEPREQQASVEIPDDWRDMTWPKLRRLASQVSCNPIINMDGALAAIEAELARR